MDVRTGERGAEHLTPLFTEEESVPKVSLYLSVSSFIPKLETKKDK